MKTAIRRWGNSLAVRIPHAYAAEACMSEGAEVELSLNSGALVVRRVMRKRQRLADLLKRITPANRHDSVDTGKPVGQENW